MRIQTPQALIRIRSLLASPTPQLVRISVKNKGCAGMSYHLEYVQKPEKFDEIVSQDGVKVVVDSKALFSIIGSEMDWQEDALMSKFVFKSESLFPMWGETGLPKRVLMAILCRSEYYRRVWMRRVVHGVVVASLD